MLNDQHQHWNAERERYRALVDALQVKAFCFYVCGVPFPSFYAYNSCPKTLSASG